MLIPLGFWAASAGGGAGGGAAFDLLETQVLASSAASVTFSSLSTYAADYQHLQIRAVGRMSASQNGASGSFRINGDTGSNYANHYLQGTGSVVQSGGAGSATSMENLYAMNAATDVTNGFAAVVIDILDPFETTKNTTVRALSGAVGNENRIRLGSGVFLNTAQVTSLTMFSTNGGNFIANSRFSLYGIKAGA